MDLPHFSEYVIIYHNLISCNHTLLPNRLLKLYKTFSTYPHIMEGWLHLIDSESFGYLVVSSDEMREVTHCVRRPRVCSRRQTDRQAARWKSLPGKSMELISEQRRLQAAAADPCMAAVDGLPFSPRSPLGRRDGWSSPSLISGKILNHSLVEEHSADPPLRLKRHTNRFTAKIRLSFSRQHHVGVFHVSICCFWTRSLHIRSFRFHRRLGCSNCDPPLLPLPLPTPASYSWQTFENLGGSSWMRVCV